MGSWSMTWLNVWIAISQVYSNRMLLENLVRFQ